MTTPMFYVAIDPAQPDAAFAACVDEPRFAKYTAKDVASWIKKGAEIRRVDAQTARPLMDNWKRKP